MVEQNKRIYLIQDKVLFNLQQKIASVYGPMCRIWTVLVMEKESMGDSGEYLNEEHILPEISQLLDQVLILLCESVNTCTYVRGLKILMAFVSDKKKFKTTIKENSQATTTINITCT